jgi:hypothetical protein
VGQKSIQLYVDSERKIEKNERKRKRERDRERVCVCEREREREREREKERKREKEGGENVLCCFPVGTSNGYEN